MGAGLDCPSLAEVQTAVTRSRSSMPIHDFAALASHDRQWRAVLHDGVVSRGTAVVGGVLEVGRAFELSAVAGRGSLRKGAWEEPGRWHLTAYLPIGVPQAMLMHLPGDLVGVYLVQIKGCAYVRNMSLISRGQCGLDVDAHGPPQDNSISFDRFMKHCSTEAQKAQRCANIFSDSDVFDKFFKGKVVHWQGLVEDDPQIEDLGIVLLRVRMGSRDAAQEPVRLECGGMTASTAFKMQKGSTVEFEGTLQRQGGRFLAWHTVRVARLAFPDSLAGSPHGDAASAGVPSDCAVCLSTRATHAFVPCGHRCVCEGCAKVLRFTSRRACPLCRQPSSCIIRVWG